MLILNSALAIRHTIENFADSTPIPILERYAALLETEPIAWVLVLQPGDTEGLLAKLRGRPFAMWEYIEALDGWYEAVFVLSDDGFGHVVLVPDRTEIDQTILDLCRVGTA